MEIDSYQKDELMETGTVSFIFLIIKDETNLFDQDEFFLEEEYYFFEFENDDILLEKVNAKLNFLKQQNKRVVVRQNRKFRRILLGTRKFCSVEIKNIGIFNINRDNGCNLAYSLFYTNKLESAKKLAKNEEVELYYYDYGNQYLVKTTEIM